MSKRQEELSKLFDRKYGETKNDSSAGSNLSPRQREIEALFNKMSVRNGVSSFDDLNNYFENSTKAVSSARDYYNAGTAGRRKASELEKIKENALKLDDFTEKKDASASVMAVGGYMTREGSARSEYLKKQGYNSLKELEDAIQKAQTSDKYDRSFGSEYEAELEDAYSGGQSALKFIEQNKDSFEDYDKLHAQLSDYLDGIKDLSDAMKGVRDYYGQWESEDVYKNGYSFAKTAEKTLKSAWESIKGGYTGASAAMSASKQTGLSMGQSAQAARENKTEEQALEEINKQRRRRADEKMNRAAQYFDNASSAEMLATWQKNAMGKLLVDVGTQVPALAGDIALSAAGSLVGVPQAGLVSMGVRAYGQGAYDARQKGLSWEKSELAGIKSAAIEVVTEKLLGGATKFAYGKGWIDNTLDAGIEKALSRMGASKTLTKGIGYLVDAGEEGIEEMISDVLNPIADRILSLQDEDGEYLNDFDINDMFYDGMVGFMLGLAGTSVNVASSSVKSIRENKKFKKLGSKYVDELLEKSAKYTPESKIAKTINEKKAKGKELSGREIKQLATETNEAIEKADIQKIEQSVKGQLEKYGEKVSVPELAAAIAKQTAGQNISKAEAQLIEDSVYGQRVVNELDPVNIRSGEYTSDWVQNIGTELVNAEQYNKPEVVNKPLPLQDAPVEEQPTREIKEPIPAMDIGEQEQFIRDRYAKQVKNGTFTEEAVQGMIEELHDGIPLESILNRVDNNIKEIENERNDSSDGSMGRELGGSSAEQSSAVQEGAGRSESPKRAADRGTKEVRRNSEKSNARQVSAKSLGLSNGTDAAKLTVVEKDKLSKTSQMISIISGAKSVTVVKGSLEVTDESGTVHRVSGVKTGDGRIIVRGDHPLYTTEQLLLHETEHMYESDEMLDEMRAAVIDAIGEPALNELCMQYAVKWGGLYSEEDMYGVASMKEKEVYADALAGISRAKTRGTKKITSAVRKVFYKHTGLDIDALLADGQPTVTEAKQNEAQNTVTEPKAQAPPNKAQYSAETDFSRDKYFDRQIDKWDEKPDGTRIKVGVLNKGSALNKVGFPAEGMWFDVGKIKKSFGKHGDHLTKTVLKEIPNLLNDPIAITEYRGPEGNIDNTVNVFGMFMPDGKTPIVVGVMMTKARNGSTIINKIRTIHAHGNAEINANNILYLNEDKKRTRNWFQVCDNSVPLEGTKFGLIRSISYTDTKSQDRIQQKEKVNSYSVDELDSEYYDALHNGNTEKAQELVDEAAKAAGYKLLDDFYVDESFKPIRLRKELRDKAYKLGEHFRKNNLVPIDWKNYRQISNYIFQVHDELVVTKYKIDGEFISLEDLYRAVDLEDKYTGVLETYFLSGFAPEFVGTPRYAFGKRIGRIPPRGASWNHRDQRSERGVSVLGLFEGGKYRAQNDGSFELFNRGQEYIVWGLVSPYIGADGENLLNLASMVGETQSLIKSSDIVTYDDNGKVIPLSKRFDRQNEDIRYSVDDTTVTEEEAQHRRDFQKIVTGESLRKLNERKTKLEGVIEGYKRIDELADYQTKKLVQLEGDLTAVNSEIEKKTKKAEERKTERKTATEVAASAVDSLHIRRTTAQSRKVLRQQIYDQYGIVSGRKDVGAMVDAFADKWISQGKISKADIDGFEDALMQSGTIQVESANEYARDIRSWMSNGQISVPQYVREEFGDDWNSIKKRAFANRIYLSIDTDHAGIDQWTKELAGSFGEGVFDDTVDLKTQLEKIIDIAEDGRDEHLTVYQMAEHMRKTQGKDIADAYLEDMHEQLISTLKSFAQSAKIEMETVKRSVYQKVRDDTLRREKAERAAEERARREFQQKTLKQLQWLKRNQNFMGNDYQKEAQRILGDIDTIAVSAANEMNWSEKHQATWKDLGRMYKWAKDNDPNFLPSKDIENIIARVEGTHLDELSASDLENIYKAAVALRTAFYNRNNVIGDELHRAFQDVFDSSKTELKEAIKPNDTTAATQKFWDSQLNPIHRINRMFGWKEDSAGFQIFGRGLEQGERATKRYVEQATQILDPWLEEHKDWVSKADGQGKDAIWYELEVPELLKFGEGNKPIFGNAVKVYMTPMQKIYMYLESKNYDNLRHMVGGRTFSDKELYSKGEREEAFAKGTTISLAPESVKKIVSNLTQTERELADILEKQYFNGYAKTEINRVSNVLYGYDRAMSDNYAPIYTNRNYNKTEPGVYQDGTAEGVGHMKTRVQGAKNPTYNVSALEAFRKHISQTSRFVGMSIPAQNAETLLNWRSDGTSLQDEITHNWSSKELDALKNVMTELQSPTYLEQSEFASAIGKLMSNYIGGVFGSNITVAAKVLASKPTAAIVLGNQYYPKPAQVKNVDTKLISKYTSELDVRIRGYGTPELAAMTLSQSKYMKWVQEHKASKLILGGGLLQAADIYVTKTMWPWAENKVRAEYPELEIGTQEEIDNGNSPFYKKVAEVYENAIGDTQSMYDIMHRSDLLRDTNEITRSFTIFHTDSLQAMNLIRLRAGQLEAAKQDAKKADSEETKAAAEAKIKTAAKELSRCIANVILMNTVVTLFDIIRDLFRHREDKYANDEGEVTFWSFLENTMLQIAENTSGLIIGADALTEVLASWITGDKYYDHEVIAVKTVNDLLDLMTDTKDELAEFVSGLSDVIKNDGDVWEYIVNDGDARGAIKTAAEKIAHFFGGIPVENVEKLLVNAIGWVLPQVSAAYSGIWETQNKSDLSNSRSLETDIKNLYRTKTDISDETAEELARLYEAGYKNAVISDTPSSVTIKDEDGEAVEKIELNEAQRQAYNAAAGKALKHIEAIISSEEYKAADDKEKAKMLSRLNQYAKDVAAAAVTDTKLTGYAANVPDWLDDGMSWGQIASGNTIDNNNASKYITAGVDPRVARDIFDTIDAIETEDNKRPSTVQKVKAVAYMTISEANKEAALSAALSKNACARYMAARKCGVSSVDYADFLEILDRVDENGGNPSQDEFKEAVRRANLNRSAAAAIWATYWKSSSPW